MRKAIRDRLFSGKNLRIIRKRKGLTITGLIEKIENLPYTTDIKRNRLIGFEKNQAPPTFSDVLDIARAIDIPLAELLGNKIDEIQTSPEHILNPLEIELLYSFRKVPSFLKNIVFIMITTFADSITNPSQSNISYQIKKWKENMKQFEYFNTTGKVPQIKD